MNVFIPCSVILHEIDSAHINTFRYVLQDFTKKEREVIDVAVAESADIVRSVMVLGLEKALSGVRA
jgi:peptidyl-tRNA hydrolase